MSRTLVSNAWIVTGTSAAKGSLLIDGGKISGIFEDPSPDIPAEEVIDLKGKALLPGCIDTHVHFRDPGMTWKGDIGSESRAAVSGGVTSFIDMPNTKPPTTDFQALEAKLRRAEEVSSANYGFHIGATNSNASLINEYLSSGLGESFGGIKVFMGSSTGNMLVDKQEALEEIFRIKGKPVLVHCEDEGTIKANLGKAEASFGGEIPFREHSRIRSREACVRSTEKAIRMALGLGTRLHILHVSTREEVEMIREAKRRSPLITAETSVNYLWFSDEDYPRMEGRLKCNPAVKSPSDREALIAALADGTIDTIGSDHAPHLPEEKRRPYSECPSGLPTISHSLPAALTIASREGIPLERIASAYSEKPAEIFGIKGRGRIAVGASADLVAIDPDKEYQAPAREGGPGWSPYDGLPFKGAVEMVWINGSLAARDGKLLPGAAKPEALRFRPIE